MNREKLGITLIIIVGIALGMYGITTLQKNEGEVTARLIIENEEICDYEATIPAGSTVVDLMKACGVSFIDEGGFITTIQGVSQDEGTQTYWIYYVNGEMAAVGARDYIIQDGDEVTWRLESYS
ncbi:MAG: DUF4430 domain-containing protein [Theionarchaea archaeon]|nr:DUF4430 domain-containing protein [Theionarchaea archaeon]